ncbi:phorbol-12-myristate-13-acetate-induced protein 1 [Lemur catta]|uniref:phorbol-12-myristate-13-acetate-induced protein 1 n=1 Tax=Lemur catta TaxID=9447 RepID=UPI001E2684FE|nr:phorbol-12-myristate-13-acetate-induced protein 1 [Lemur catta]
MPMKRARRNAQPNPARPRTEIQEECALQLRRIGDKLHFQQKLLNLIAKLLRSGT